MGIAITHFNLCSFLGLPSFLSIPSAAHDGNANVDMLHGNWWTCRTQCKFALCTVQPTHYTHTHSNQPCLVNSRHETIKNFNAMPLTCNSLRFFFSYRITACMNALLAYYNTFMVACFLACIVSLNLTIMMIEVLFWPFYCTYIFLKSTRNLFT